MDLIKKMLNLYPRHRPSAEEVLKHDWLTENSNNGAIHISDGD